MKKLYLVLYAIAMVATIYYNGLNDPRAKLVSMVLFAVLFVLALIKRWQSKTNPKIFNKWLMWFLLACASNFLLAFNKMSTDSLLNMEIAMPLMVAFSSYYLLDINRDKLSLYLLPICFFAAFCATTSVLSGLGGFSVAEGYDDTIAKNQVGAAFASFAIICAVFSLEKKNLILKSAFALLSVINLYPAIYFACRTALLSYIVVVTYLMFKDYKWKGVMVLPIIVMLVVLFGGEELQDLLYDSIVRDRDANDFDSVSSGRLSQASISFSYFFGHPFLGFFGSGDGFNVMPPNAHIYLLYRLTKWGIIGAIPFIALYFSIFKVLLRSIKLEDLLISGLLLLAFVESFAEYSPPFGPGSCFIITFVLIGNFLKKGNITI